MSQNVTVVDVTLRMVSKMKTGSPFSTGGINAGLPRKLIAAGKSRKKFRPQVLFILAGCPQMPTDEGVAAGRGKFPGVQVFASRTKT